MRAQTAAVVGPIVTDLRASGYIVTLDEDPDHPHHHDQHPTGRLVMVSTPEGGSNGIDVGAPGDPVDPDRVCAAAHALQDGIVDAGFYATGTATIWPPCPHHPGTHPLTPTVRGLDVVWACLSTREAICLLGQLADIQVESQR